MSDVAQFGRTQNAIQTPFDPSGSLLVSTDVESAIKELSSSAAIAAAPGFTWGRSGNSPSNTWLLNDTVPANRSGRTVMMTDAKIEKASVATENIATYDIGIYQHEGNEVNLTLLYTVNVVATRSAQFTVPSVAAGLGKQIAIQITSGSARNLVVGLIMKGTLA